MGWDPETLHDAERLLNRGQPSGPRMDALWEKVRAQAVPRPRPWWRAAWTWTLLPALAAGMFLWVMPADSFRARGERGSALLEASCGTAAAPCRVGQAVFLRVMPVGTGTVSVMLVSSTGRAWLGGPVPVPSTSETPLAVKVLPDAADVARGLEVRVFLHASAPAETEQSAALQGDERVSPAQVLHLEVRP